MSLDKRLERLEHRASVSVRATPGPYSVPYEEARRYFWEMGLSPLTREEYEKPDEEKLRAYFAELDEYQRELERSRERER